MRIGARNRLEGKLEIAEGAAIAHPLSDAGGPIVAASAIGAAVDDPKPAAGREAPALLKASGVMAAIG